MSLTYNIDLFMLYSCFLKTFEHLDCTCHLLARVQTIVMNMMLTKEVCGERDVKKNDHGDFFLS